MKTVEEVVDAILDEQSGYLDYDGVKIADIIRADREACEAEFKAKLARVLVEVNEFGEILAMFDMGIYPNAAVRKEAL